MNKQELAADVAVRAAVSEALALAVIEATLAALTSALVRGDTVRLVGFGQFVVSDRRAVNGRNPRTGDPMDVPARRLPRFRPGQHLRAALN